MTSTMREGLDRAATATGPASASSRGAAPEFHRWLSRTTSVLGRLGVWVRLWLSTVLVGLMPCALAHRRHPRAANTGATR